MKKNEIEAGAVLGYQRRAGWHPVPAMVLDAGQLWTEEYSRYNNTYTYTPSPAASRPQWGKRFISGFRDSTGYLAVISYHVEYDETGQREAIAEMRTLTGRLEGSELTNASVAELDRQMPDGLTLTVVNNRHLVGAWDDAVTARKAEDERKRRENEARRRLGEWRRDAFAALDEAACAHAQAGTAAIVLRHEGEGRVSMTYETLARIVGTELPPRPTDNEEG